MGTTDSNGIYFYADTDNVSPLHTLLNLGQQSVTDTVTGLKATKTRVWQANRAAGADAPFTTANTGLATLTVTLDPGTYRITGRNVLYSSAGTDGNLFILVGAVYTKARWALSGGSLPIAPEISHTVTHAGGSMTVTTGYDVATGTAVNIAAGTMVRIEFLGT